uniref:Uncharacterized protein n=1 Tax=Globodera rostochiensis TaxID=31243 RepID=A0A914GUQ9_GLORO
MLNFTGTGCQPTNRPSNHLTRDEAGPEGGGAAAINWLPVAVNLNLTEILLSELHQLEVKVQDEKWTTNPINVFDNIISLLSNEHRSFNCNETKHGGKACDSAGQFEQTLRMEAEGLDKTGQLRHEVTMQFINHLAAIQKTEKEKKENLDVSPQGTALKSFFKSAEHRQIYTVFVGILRRLSNNLGPGLQKEAIDKLFDDANKPPTRNDLVKLSMKLWIAMFPPSANEHAQNVAAHFMGHDGTGGQAKQLKNKTPKGAAGVVLRPLKQIGPLLREAAAAAPHRFRRSALRRRRKRDSEMIKHVTVLGVSLFAAYFIMTRLKTALINTIDYFDNTVTIFGAAVVLYLATLYTIEKRFKKVTEPVKKAAEASKDNNAKTESDAASSAIFEALVRPTKTKMMDIESYRQFMEEVRGVKLELADVYGQYTEYRTQMAKIKDRRGLKGAGYSSSATTAKKHRIPRERTQTEEEYGRRTDDVERATTTNSININSNNNDSEMASKLPIPGFYESRTKGAKKPH